MDGEMIVKAVQGVTKKWCKQRKAEERNRSRQCYRRAALVSSQRVTLKAAAWRVMEEAYLKASTNGTLPAHARQIMYAARGRILELTGAEALDDKYFTQTLLPDYLNEHPEATAAWDVVFDARGHFWEPHTAREVPLGTLDVRQYLRGQYRAAGPVRVRGLFPTRGAGDRFGAVLFIEKEGFLPLFHRVELAERYDLAIMSTKGMSVVAARLLVDKLCGAKKIPLLVLHDFDKSGFSILGTVRHSNRRYCFTHPVNVIDFGLRLADVQALELEAENVHVDDTYKFRANLRRNGATPEEVDFLCGGQRVELNALASGNLVAWVEGKLAAHGIKKVIPGDEVLAKAYRQAFIRQAVQDEVPELIETAKTAFRQYGVPEGLRALVEARIAADPRTPWDVAVARVAGMHLGE